MARKEFENQAFELADTITEWLKDHVHQDLAYSEFECLLVLCTQGMERAVVEERQAVLTKMTEISGMSIWSRPRVLRNWLEARNDDCRTVPK